MHIPDGFIDAPVALATGAASLAIVGYSLRRVGRDLGERTVPLLGVTAAFVFAAQMLNFPVAGGTSGHFLGAILAAVLMGPWAATIVLTVVLGIQAVGMADGGITALGANVFNMAVVAGLGGYLVFLALRRLLGRSANGYFFSVAGAAWVSVVAASAAASLELSLSGTVPLRATLPAMVSVHMVIGLGEALITSTVVAAVLAARPDLVKSCPRTALGAYRMQGRRPRRRWAFVAGSMVVALALAVFISPFASSSPDGLEKVAQSQGFSSAAQTSAAARLSPLAGYSIPGLRGHGLSTAIAGGAGTILLFSGVLLVGRLFTRPRKKEHAGEAAVGLSAHPGAIHPLRGHEHTDHRHSGHTHSGHPHVPSADEAARLDQ